jgi:CBS domain-containing protein
VDRLRAAAGKASITTEGAQNLEDAYRFIATLRVQHQARQMRAGRKADNYLAPEELSDLERSQLKDAFAIIATMQETLESRYLMARRS